VVIPKNLVVRGDFGGDGGDSSSDGGDSSSDGDIVDGLLVALRIPEVGERLIGYSLITRDVGMTSVFIAVVPKSSI